jgi:hypothetical protein
VCEVHVPLRTFKFAVPGADDASVLRQSAMVLRSAAP